MKVLLVDQIHNVNYKYTDSLVKALNEKGVDAKAATYFISGEKGYSKIQKVLNYISSYRRLCKEIKAGEFDTVNLQWYILSPVDYYFVKKIKKIKVNGNSVKVVQTVHDIYPFHEYFFDKKFFDKLYRLCDEIVLQTEHAYKEFNELFPDLNNRTTMIPHGNFCDYAEPVDIKEAREKLGISIDKNVMLFYGQIKKVKGLKTALEALTIAKDKVDNLMFVIAGKDQDDGISNYNDYIAENKLSDYLKIENRYIEEDEEKYFLSAADVVLLPYTEIYQSGVIQVAFAYNKPVIVSDLPGFTELVTDGENGYVFESGNGDKLAEKIEMVFSTATSKPTSDNTEVTNRLSWSNIAEKYENIYRCNCNNS